MTERHRCGTVKPVLPQRQEIFISITAHPEAASRWGRTQISGAVLAAAVLVLCWLASDILLMVFAACLVALFLNGVADWIARRTGMPYIVALLLTCLLLAAGLAVMGLVAAPVLADQAGELWKQVQRGIDALRGWTQRHAWASALTDQISPSRLLSSGGSLAGTASSALTATFGGLGTLAAILVIGVFLAASPGIYAAGIVILVAPAGRPRAREVLEALAHTLRRWLLAQFLSMAVIGLLTMLGLWILGVPLAAVLGVIAALLTFIPNLGPILAAVPALLLALADSPSQLLWVGGLYVLVQLIEGNVTTPLIQQHTIALPPALILAVQLLMAGLFGLLGLALATPLAAGVITLVRCLYVEDYLERGIKPS
jgi:predicted PurR-regulated permease PerM